MKILVTGSSGTVGTRLCERLLEIGHDVVGWDIQPNIYNDDLNEITEQVDLRCPISTEQRAEMVIHLANHARVWNLVQEPQLAFENMQMNFNIIEWCRQRHVFQIIFASSREVYGNIKRARQNRGIDEKSAVLHHCESPYSASKMQGEALLHSYRNCYGIQSVIIRLSNVYGMYDFSDRVIPKWIKACSLNEPLYVNGPFKTLDFTYIDDTVAGIVSVIPNFQDVQGRAYNIATGIGTRLSEVAERLKEMMGSSSEIETRPELVGEVNQYKAHIFRAQRKLGYNPQVFLREGLQKTVEWYKGVGYV